jgi:hypothetical protein
MARDYKKAVAAVLFNGGDNALFPKRWNPASAGSLDPLHVRFWENSGHRDCAAEGLLLTQSGHRHSGLLPCKPACEPHFAGRKSLL